MITEVLYYTFIYPMQTLLGAVFEWLYAITHSYGLAIVLLSLCVNVFLLKLTHLSESKARAVSALKSACDRKIAEFKKVFRGAELHAYTQILFKQKHYHPIYNLFSIGGLALQIPFFLGVLFLLQDFEGLQGARFGVIEDLSKPDTLLFGYALLPFVMSLLSLINVFVSSKERGARVQGSLIALIFLVLLYVMPSGLVVYWSVSMGFSLLRTLLGLRHSAFLKKLRFGDKSLILRSGFGHYRLGSSLHPSLENNDFSSKILECQDGKPSVECKASSESSVGLESSPTDSKDSQKQSIESSLTDSESKIITQSTTSKTLNEALPNINNNGRSSASRVESNFAKSHTNSEFAHTEPHEILASCDDFVGYQARGAGSYLSGSDQAPSVDSRKSAQEANLLSRFKNVLHAIFTPHKDLDSKTYLTYRNISIFALLNIFFLIFVFSPFAVYSSDVSQFDPSQTFQTLGGLFGFFLLFSFLGIYTTSFFYKTRLLKLGAYGVSVILCIGLVYTFIFTGNIFNGPHAPLDHLLFQDGGGALRHAYNAYADLVIGFVMMVLVFIILIKLRLIYLKILKVIIFSCVVLAFISLVAIIQSWTTEQKAHNVASADSQASSNIPAYTQSLLSFSKEQPNILVLVLDAFTGSHMELLLGMYPHLAEELDGFVYFDNTLSGAGFTHLTTPTLIGGEYYTTYNLLKRGVSPQVVDAQSFYAGDEAFGTMAKAFADNGYQVDLHNISPSKLTTEDIDNELVTISSSERGEYSSYFLEQNPNLSEELELKVKNTLPIADLANIGLFKFSSFRTRGWLYPEAWRFGSNLSIEHFRREVVKSSAYLSFPQLSNANATKPTFKYIKTLITHSPWRLDIDTCLPTFSDTTILPNRYKKYVYDKTYYTYMNNELCALKTLTKWIHFLKENGIYDNTQLFVVSDHGAWYTFKQMEQNYGIRIGHNFNPLVMIKDFKKHGHIQADSRLVANYDIATVFCENIPGACKNVGANVLTHYQNNREIPFVHLQSGKILDSYLIREDAYNPKNWREIDPKTFIPKEH